MPRIAARAMMSTFNEIVHVGEAASGGEAIGVLARTPADVVLLDVDMPGIDGPDAARQILAEHPDTKILAWTVSDANEDLLRMIKSGCVGYVLKDVGPEELRRAILAAIRGETPVPRRMFPDVLRIAAEQAPTSAGSAAALTSREHETLRLMAKGMPVKRIAAEMSISPSSVDTHLRNLYRKLHVTNRAEAVNAAIRAGLIRVGDL
jgi:DNA-binding NarL/FixJ family response regulator